MASTTSLAAPDLVIASAATDSNATSLIAEAEAITIYAPAALTGTVKVQVTPQPDDTAAASITWYDLVSSGTIITIAINTAVTINSVGGLKQLRLKSDGAEGATRTFKATLQVRNY